MQGFMLSSDGDVVIENGDIMMINGNELLRQTVESVLKTNKGEWFMNWDEGMDFSNILRKGVSEDDIKSEILAAVKQVDDTLSITAFLCEQIDRKIKISVFVKRESGEVTEAIDLWL